MITSNGTDIIAVRGVGPKRRALTFKGGNPIIFNFLKIKETLRGSAGGTKIYHCSLLDLLLP